MGAYRSVEVTICIETVLKNALGSRPGLVGTAAVCLTVCLRQDENPYHDGKWHYTSIKHICGGMDVWPQKCTASGDVVFDQLPYAPYTRL